MRRRANASRVIGGLAVALVVAALSPPTAALAEPAAPPTGAPSGTSPGAPPGPPGTPPGAPPAQSSTTLLRTTLVVADVDRAAGFYALLGFEVENSMGGTRDPAVTKFPLNAASTGFRLLILANPSGGGRLGLLQFDDPAPAATRPARERIGVGDAVLVLDVADAQALYESLLAVGAKIVAPAQTFRSRQKDEKGRPLEGRVLHVFDPDGNLVELLEAPKPPR